METLVFQNISLKFIFAFNNLGKKSHPMTNHVAYDMFVNLIFSLQGPLKKDRVKEEAAQA